MNIYSIFINKRGLFSPSYQNQNGSGCELLPVKRTVKNHKIFSTSNVKVAGHFFTRRHCCAESADEISVSGCARDTSKQLLAGGQPASVCPRPLVRERIFRVAASRAARQSRRMSLDSASRSIRESPDADWNGRFIYAASW